MSIFSRNDRVVSRHMKAAKIIQEDVDKLSQLSDEQLLKSFQDLKKVCSEKGFFFVRLKALAMAASAMLRTTGLRPFDVQLIGAMVLLDSGIAQMRTGEGKTLTATLAALAQSIEGKGAHVVTVNDYLAKRDSEQTAKIANLLGQSVGLVFSNQPLDEKNQAYQSDITYATNTELGFDFLRNNMRGFHDEPFMRELYFVVVDEIDSILIDEARTPLIISEPDPQNDELFRTMDEVAKKLQKGEVSSGIPSQKVTAALKATPDEETGDFIVNEKERQLHLTEQGFSRVEDILQERGLLKEGDSLYAAHNLELVYHIEAALKAHHLYRNNIQYIIRDNEILIVDEHTGRVLPGRRWGRGLHQAIEAKEGLQVQEETRVAASITLQNLFREYPLLSGMTGTALTEAGEFASIYNLEVIVIPTHKPMIRDDSDDHVFLSKEAKVKAILEEVGQRHALGQPILIGTTDVAASEEYSALLTEHGFKHEVLNAKQHEREAHVIAQAGRMGSITIATNMAGRGTDIILGGNAEELMLHNPDLPSEEILKRWKEEHDEVVKVGGLHVIGTERHESRRIDDQLRGRAGRQGDPGSSRFYVSFDDDLMRLFGGNWARDTLRVMGMGDKAIESSIVSRQIEKAQRAIETQNFNARKQLLDFDDVSNEQRQRVYEWRKWLQKEENQEEFLRGLVETWVNKKVAHEFGGMLSEKSDEDMQKSLQNIFPMAVSGERHDNPEEISHELIEQIWAYITENNLIAYGCQASLGAVDAFWREHLVLLENVRSGIHLRGYAQKQPKQEYKKEAYQLFKHMLENADDATMRLIFREKDREEQKNTKKPVDGLGLSQKKDILRKLAKSIRWKSPEMTRMKLASRLNLCSCGSGKALKYCCGSFLHQNRELQGVRPLGFKTHYNATSSYILTHKGGFFLVREDPHSQKPLKPIVSWGTAGVNY